MDLGLVHTLRTHLLVLLEQSPNNESVKSTLGRLQVVEQDLVEKKQNTTAWLTLLSELLHLQRDGIWGTEEDHVKLLEHVRITVEKAFDDPPGLQISVQTTSLNPMPVQVHLPPELLARINEAFYFHMLVTDSSKYPPSQKHHSLREQVSEAVTRAFWDEVPYLLLKNLHCH